MKLGLIIGQEYKNRVAKKSFLLLTILTPILFAALIIVPIKLAQLDSDDDLPIAVIDQTGLYRELFVNDSTMKFEVIGGVNGNWDGRGRNWDGGGNWDGSLIRCANQKNRPDFPCANQENRPDFQENRPDFPDYRAFVVIDEDLAVNPSAVSIYSEKAVSHDVQSSIEKMLSQYVERQKLASYNIPEIEKIIADSRTEIHAKTYKMDDEGDASSSNTEVAALIGILATTLIYMFIFISGSQVMNSVVQEKVNRIVEVMVCSVKPWELMFGKIISVALVSLTQIAIWFVLTLVFAGIGAEIAGLSLSELSTMPASTPEVELSETESLISSVMSVNWGLIFVMFIVYFIGGYLLYASLFAAVGAAVDNESDTSQFMMPITLLVLFALYAGIYSAQNPDGPLAFWCSMIPFTSPIVMMVRIPFEVPAWQLATSLALLAATVVLMVWLSAKIYRVGILMYGKKPTWRELFKWFRY